MKQDLKNENDKTGKWDEKGNLGLRKWCLKKNLHKTGGQSSRK